MHARVVNLRPLVRGVGTIVTNNDNFQIAVGLLQTIQDSPVDDRFLVSSGNDDATQAIWGFRRSHLRLVIAHSADNCQIRNVNKYHQYDVK
jgi:hypothetical protein